MKKTKLLAAALLAVTMTASAGALAACNNTDEHKCGHVCPTCQKCTSDCTDEVCKDKCEGHGTTGEPTIADLTVGVYSNVLQQGREFNLKFYADNVFYLGSWDVGYRGKYEIKNESISVANVADDGTIIDQAKADKDGVECKWITMSKVVYFYQDDGTTPITVNNSVASVGDLPSQGLGYAYGTAKNVLAYDEANDRFMCAGISGYTRSLTHNKLSTFSINDEYPIVQEKFMVKTLPDDAEEGKDRSDYYLELTQKGSFTNISELIALNLQECVFEKTGENTYKLTDMATDTQATLTKTATGATVTVGTTTIELVTWEEKYAVKMTSNKGATLTLYENGTVALKGSITVTGTYITKADNTVEITFAASQYNPVAKNCTYTGGVLALSVEIPGMVTFDFSGTVEGDLYKPSGVTTLKELTATANLGIDVTFTLALKSDCTFVVTNSMNQEAFNITGKWALAMEGSTPKITFSEVNKGTFTFTLAQNVTFAWTGTLGQAGEKTLTFTMPATDLSALQGAKPAVTTKKELTTTANLGVDVTFTLALKSDGSFIVTNSMNQEAFNITGKWALAMEGSTPKITFSEVNKGTFTFTLAQNVTFAWTGTLGQAGEKTLTFTMPATDLSALQ